MSAIINVMKLSKYFNEIINENEKTLQNKVTFNDMVIFDKRNNKYIDIESLLYKKMNPSFKFFIAKNLKLIKILINSKLNDEDIAKILSPQSNEIFIPFWVFLIRNMSSINCINYENRNNPICDEISEDVKQKIEEKINEKGEELDNSWMNLILENIPNEIKINNIRLFYTFFNNLFENLYANELLKEKIQNILKNYYFELIDYCLDGKIYKILKSDITQTDNSILKLIESPKKHIKKLIFNDYQTKAKNMVIDKYQDLENNLDKLINEIPNYLERIKDNVTKVEKIYNEDQEKVEIDNKIKEIEDKLKDYNNWCDKLLLKEENEIQYENQIHPEYIDKLKKAEYEISEYKELLKEKEKINYWIVPFKYQKNIDIYYEDNNRYKLEKGNSMNSTLYFKNKIEDKNMEKFSLINNRKDEKKELKEYIKFEQAKNEEISKYSFNVDDESKSKIKEKFTHTSEPKKVNFKGRSFDEISSEINDLKSILIEIKNNLTSLKKGYFESLNLEEIKEKYKKNTDDLKIHFDIKNNEINDSIDFTQITEIKTKLEEYLISIQNELELLCDEKEKILGNNTKKIIEDLDKIYIDNYNMPLLPEEKPHDINYDNLNIDSSLLSMPMISKKDGVLKCNYNKISFQKGPFYPELYSKPIILNIVSLVDEEIFAEIQEFPEEEIIKEEKEEEENEIISNNNNKESQEKEESEEKEENEKNFNESKEDNNISQNIPIYNRKDLDSYKYMKVKNYIRPREQIQIEIYIPNLLEKGKKENQRIRRLLKLTSGNTNCQVEIEMKILTLPIETLLSCKDYQLEFIKGNYHLKANKLFAKEKLNFDIQNYIQGESYTIKERIDSLEGNTSKQPKINIEENKIIVNIPDVENNEPKRIYCKIECYISQNYKIPIIIDSVIIPIYYTFQVYDFSNHCFTSNNIEILIPSEYNKYDDNFIKCLPENNYLTLDIHFIINFPCKNKKIKAIISAESKQELDFKKKEIIIENEKTEFSCRIKIDCGNFFYYDIATFKCSIENNNKEIKLVKKNLICNLKNINPKEMELFKYYYNDSYKSFRWDQIKEDNQINSEGIYIFPFGFWNYQIVKYNKKYDYESGSGYYYTLEPIPKNNKIFFINNNGNIEQQDDNFQSYSYRDWKYLGLNKVNSFPLFGICKNEWYPLIVEYEEPDELFGTHLNIDSLNNKYQTFKYYYTYKNNKRHYYYIDEWKFLQYLEKCYPETYSKMTFRNRQNNQSHDDYLNYIFNIMEKENTLDVLKRFKNLKKNDNSFSFSYFAYLIFEKTKETLNSLVSFLPEIVKKDISIEINYILSHIDFEKQDWVKFNETKLNLIKKIYDLFKNKKIEIEKNKNILNLSTINYKELNKEVDKLQKKFYSFSPSNKKIALTDSIGKLTQKILSIEQDLKKSEENIKNDKDLDKKEKEIIPVIADKFLIIDGKSESVDITKQPIKPINLSAINNKSNTIDEIEIDDINKPNSYSINLLMEYYGSCILKTQMIPAFIRYAFINKNQEQITKANNILSTLFNLYKMSDKHNFSLISPRIKEFQNSFEIMFSKLKKSGVGFSKEDLRKINYNENKEIQDYIILPEKDNFIIRPSHFEEDDFEEGSTINITNGKRSHFTFKRGIQSIQDSQIFNLQYENLTQRNRDSKVAQKKRKKSVGIKVRKKSSIYNKPQPIINVDKDLQKVYTILDDNNNISPPSPIIFNLNKNILPKRGLVKKKDDDKRVKMTGKNFEGKNFDIEKEINRVIEKMKNINKKKLKLDEFTEREGKLDKLFNSDKLKEILKEEKVEIKNDSNIYKILESSEFLSSRIFSNISKLNLTEEIPYKNLEVNILLDCARTISDTEKFFVILQVCALTTVFYSLEIPYLISVVGDSSFKVVLKELDEEHCIENLQKALDCIFIKRCSTNIASCIKTATDQFKALDNENSQRVFYMFTNGLDEEFALYEQWKDRIFTNQNHSFAFILSKPKSIKEEQSQFLTKFWDKFSRFCKAEENKLPVELIEMSKEKLYTQNKDIFEINEEYINLYIKSILNVLRRYKDKDNNNKIEKSYFEIKELNNIPSKENLKNLGNILIDNSFREIKEEPYTKKIKMPLIQEAIPKLGQNEIKEISKNIGSTMKVSNSINNDDKNEIRTFMKLFKIRKEKINLSILDLIFKPNLPTQTILTDVGTHIDVNELIKYFLNPTPNPRIYRELGDGFVKNYGVTVIIDSSISCFSPLSSQHTWNTIQVLLSAIGSIDLPCFDLIVTGNPNPYVICSEKNSLDILSEKSQIWPILFDLLNRNIKNTDLASAIKAAYNLHNLRKADHPDFLFVVTDGLFSLSETKRIINNVIFCMIKGLNIFGIGVGISPFGIEKLFPNVIYSLNPDKLIRGIASCFSGNSSNNTDMKLNFSGLKITFNDSNIEDSQKKPLYKKLKNELINIPVELSGYDYYQTEIPQNAKEEELTGDGKFSVHNYGMYEKNYFQGQKLLIVMPYSCGMNKGEDERLSYEYITKSMDNTECIQSSIDYTGIQSEVVINYKDAIERLIRPGTYKKGCCDYYACIIMSGEPYAELPNSNDNPYLLGQFIKVIKQFWENGGALGLFADNAPFNYQINILIEELFPNANFRVAGNHPGMQTIFGDDSGKLIKKATFNRDIQMIDNYKRNIISHSLYSIYEGKTISYFVEKPEDDNLLYYGKNEDLNMITDPKKLLPFVPFSKDSDGGFNSLFYSSNDDKGDIVIDCSYTKFFLEMGTKGTPRYIQNIVSWLAAPEKHQKRDSCKDGSDFRPKAIDIQLDWNHKWNRFKQRPRDLTSPENMKTLFAVDCSSSISGVEIYFKKLKELRLKYYNSSRGDKFYTWGSNYYYKNETEMDKFIENKSGPDGTYSYYIAEIGKETKNEKFEHLIIVTDGEVDTDDIDESDKRVKEYGLQYSFVSTYIIGRGGDESVGCPFSRGCPGETHIIDEYGKEIIKASLSKEDQQALDNIDTINNWNTFKSKYENLFNSIRAKCLGRNADEELKNKLNNLKNRIKDAQNEEDDFTIKFNNLYKMADGQIRNVKNASTAA